MNHGRFERANNYLVRFLVRALATGMLLIAIAWYGVPWLGRLFPRTLAERESGGAGYRITENRWQWSGFEIRLWRRDRTEIRLRFRKVAIDASTIAHEIDGGAVRISVRWRDFSSSAGPAGEYRVTYNSSNGSLQACVEGKAPETLELPPAEQGCERLSRQ